jgi:exopolyphosphatase/guanosine-5'-triphosphate,3'-diphosphate pyrophosphatase
MTRYAALDIGSNSIKLLVADVDGGGAPAVRYDRAVVTRLSEGLQRSGRLSDEPMARTIAVIRQLLAEAGWRQGDPIGAISTAPCRRASNGAEFIRRLAEATGIEAEIVSGEREADLSLLATRRAFPDLDPMLMADLGGASTELVLCAGEDHTAPVSVDIGAVRVTEACFGDGETAEGVRAARAMIREAFDAGFAAVGREARGAELVLVSGTATSLASVALDLERYEPERVHGLRLERAQVDALIERLGAMSVDERRHLRSLDPARADVIFAGALLVEALCDAAGGGATISDRGTRWGVLWDAVARGSDSD